MYVAKFIDKYYPAVIIKFTKTCGNASQEEFDEYLQKFAELYERKEKFNILFAVIRKTLKDLISI